MQHEFLFRHHETLRYLQTKTKDVKKTHLNLVVELILHKLRLLKAVANTKNSQKIKKQMK